MNGRYSHSDHSIGITVASATCVGYCSASVFGTSSPTTTLKVVEHDEGGDARRRPRRSAASPLAHGMIHSGDGRRDRRLAVGAEDQAGEGDADLAGGDVGVEPAGVADERRSRSARKWPSSAIWRTLLRRTLIAENSAAT